MRIPFFLVDAFTEKPFQGNPACICLLESPAHEEWMQKVAMEMNQAETAFLVPGGEAFQLRWFTPAAEVALCGHATLASAHILWETDTIGEDQPAMFDTKSGRLTCNRAANRISMDFPAKPAKEAQLPNRLTESISGTPVWTGQNGMDALVELSSEAEVRELEPDFAGLSGADVRGVIVTARSTSADYDFVSRFFAPGLGVREDPVTGSAHCCLCPYWAEKLGKEKMTGYQASKRGGFVGVRLCGERVILSGSAVTVVKGELAA